MRELGRWLLLATLWLAPQATDAGVGDDFFADSNVDADVEAPADEEYAEEDEDDGRQAEPEPSDSDVQALERDRASILQFQRLMQKNVAVPQSAEQFDLGADAPPETPRSAALPDRQVEVPLAQWRGVHSQLEALRQQRARPTAIAVVLGAARYRGRALEGALAIELELDVTLGTPGFWKSVPLIGESVVVTSASVDGRPVPLHAEDGYHVWVTDRVGEATVRLSALVPAQGPRGSIEFEMLVPQTPVTTFDCVFAVAGLEPRVSAAVQSSVTSTGAGAAGSTRLVATLRPTTRVHLVGFRDLGAGEASAAKMYADASSLVSIDKDAIDVFTVVRYGILYAGVREFRVRLPAEGRLVSADGEGAFRYVVEETPEGRVLRGETAFPIRNSYEISLRLRRELKTRSDAAAPQVSFDLGLPQPMGVERSTAWIAVEVTGNLKLAEERADHVQAVDVRQLPPEMLASAVSPILRAYHDQSGTPAIRLAATPLPEKEPASAAIDSVRATTVLSAEGRILTDLRLTMRNRQRHHVALTLPEGSEVMSAFLDGQPVKPSRSDQGALLLPLKRSADERAPGFTVQVVLQATASSLGLVGIRRLRLPTFDLAISSLEWSLHLPARNAYTRPRGDIGLQGLAGEGEWYGAARLPQPHDGLGRSGVGPGGGGLGELGAAANRLEGGDDGSGAMPVKVEVPRGGKVLRWRRYWLAKDELPSVWIGFARTFLLPPLGLGSVLFAFGLGVVAGRSPQTRRRRRTLAAAGVTALLLLLALDHLGLGLVALAAGAALSRREALRARLAGQWQALREVVRADLVVPTVTGWARLWWWSKRLALAGIVAILLMTLASGLWDFAQVLLNPLPG